MPRTKIEFQNMRLNKIEIIKEAALTCFAIKGFQNTTMADISKEAKISTGLAYNYFSSKDELLKSLYSQGLEKIFAPLKDYKKPMTKENLRHFINHIFQELERDIRFWKLYFIVMTHPDTVKNYSGFIMQSVQLYLSSIKSFFAEKGYSDPEIETRFFISVLDGICLNFLMDTEHFPIQSIKAKILKQYAE